MPRRKARALRATVLSSGLVLGAYSGCTPDLDELSSEYGFGGVPSGGNPSSGGSNATGGASGDAATNSGGAAGSAGSAGEAGSPIVGAGGKPMTGSGGEPSASGGTTVVGMAGSGGAGASTGASAGATGEGGSGGVACEGALVTCPGAAECATDLMVGNAAANTVHDCGACGVTCSVANASGAECTAGRCKASCSEGFADCNSASANDGCEASLTSTASCGSCGHACSNVGAATLACMSGHCAPTCLAAFADCNVDDGVHADDGCEFYLDALSHCGTSCTSVTACPSNQVCNAGVCGSAQGLVQFSVPLMATSDDQRYADKFNPLRNLAGSTLTIRMYAPGATGGAINIYFSDADFTAGGGGSIVSLSTLALGWTDVVVSAGTVSGSYDPTQVSQVNLEVIGSGGAPYTNPTVIYVDSVHSTNLSVNDNFDTGLDNMVKSSLQNVASSTLTWVDAIAPP